MAYITPETQYSQPSETLVDRVKTIMDELDQQEIISVGVSVNYPVDTMIRQLFPEAKRAVLYEAPLLILPKAEKQYDSTAATYNAVLDAAAISLPDDCIRVSDIICTGAGTQAVGAWAKPATELVSLQAQKAVRQAYKYARATAKNPGAAVVDGTIVYAFPYPKTIESDVAVYGTVKLHYVSNGTKYSDLGEKATDALCWNCAMRVYTAMGMPEMAAKCAEIYANTIK